MVIPIELHMKKCRRRRLLLLFFWRNQCIIQLPIQCDTEHKVNMNSSKLVLLKHLVDYVNVPTLPID